MARRAPEEPGPPWIVKWDLFPVSDGERVRIVFESVTSPWRQGVCLRTDRGLRVNGELLAEVHVWRGEAAEGPICECSTANGLLAVYNIWDRGWGAESQAWSSGMLVEALQNGRRYRCRDLGDDAAFDRVIFRLERA